MAAAGVGGLTGFVRGEAPWALFIHGFAGAPWDWCRVLTQLGPQRPAALIEIPGHGPRNRKPEGDWTSITGALGLWLEKFSVSRLLDGWSTFGWCLEQTGYSQACARPGGHTGLDGEERDTRRLWDLEQSEHLQSETMKEFRQRWGLYLS